MRLQETWKKRSWPRVALAFAINLLFLAVMLICLFMIPLAILLPKFFGLIGLELAQPIGDLLTFILAIILQSRVLRMLNQPDRTAEDA